MSDFAQDTELCSKCKIKKKKKEYVREKAINYSYRKNKNKKATHCFVERRLMPIIPYGR